MSSALVCALDEALAIVEEEGLEARWARHERNHRTFVEGLKSVGVSVLPPEGERLWTLNAVRVPEGIDDARLSGCRGIQHGSAPVSDRRGKIWAPRLMGASSAPRLIVLLLGALDNAMTAQGRRRMWHRGPAPRERTTHYSLPPGLR
jgi:alanine-glyoxylate transaminase/serine-glyoxylate transaminase/serine-pyruvate transaminase